ncbi:hypothetical protein INR49_028427 [Caranx melampygus]|nr:hypothetical protein INR49_028427 [Caranx melampygus]
MTAGRYGNCVTLRAVGGENKSARTHFGPHFSTRRLLDSARMNSRTDSSLVCLRRRDRAASAPSLTRVRRDFRRKTNLRTRDTECANLKVGGYFRFSSAVKPGASRSFKSHSNSMSETKPSQRFHSLNAEQVEVLHQVLSEVVPIHGRGNFPTLELRPRDIIIAVRARLQKQGITVIKESVLGCLLDCLPAGVNRERISSATMKEAYVQKMVKVFNEHDRWSLISLSNNSGKNLELKFVSALRRQFEFSVDSFQIILDRLLESYMQQESQQKTTIVDLKEQPAENQSKDPPSLLKQPTAPEKESIPGRDSPSKEGAQISPTQQGDKVHEKGSQTDLSQQTEHSKQTKESKMENDNTEKTPTELEEVSEIRDNLNETDVPDQTSLNLLSEKIQTSEKTETPTQIELRHEPTLSDDTNCSTKAEQSELSDHQQPAHSNHEELSVQKEMSSHRKPLTNGKSSESRWESPSCQKTQKKPRKNL